jgi:hypothetical protein
LKLEKSISFPSMEATLKPWMLLASAGMLIVVDGLEGSPMGGLVWAAQETKASPTMANRIIKNSLGY